MPTESQWEYACRAGTTTAYSWGNASTPANANYSTNGLGQTIDVGQYAGNLWGFFDMHGNVYEWTGDWYSATYPIGNPVINPTGPVLGSNRVRRGGSWEHDGRVLRSAKRAIIQPSARLNYIGFRLAFQQIKTPPSDLNATAPLAFAENQPAGTEVGEFNATDPDVNATLTYYLVSGAGDGNNSLFILETNGTLRTATIFDYESNASNYSIRVQVRNEFNAIMEGNFTVILNDVLEYPIYSGFDGNGSTQITVLENTRDIIPMPFSYQPDGNLTFTIGGSDALRFERVGNQGFRFIGLSDFELPLDQGGDNIYDLNLTASYPNNLSTSRLLSVQVLDVNETSWVFTNASATGRNGPTQAQLDSAYANTLAGKVTSLPGIQQWTPPFRGNYYVRAFGAAGSQLVKSWKRSHGCG